MTETQAKAKAERIAREHAIYLSLREDTCSITSEAAPRSKRDSDDGQAEYVRDYIQHELKSMR